MVLQKVREEQKCFKETTYRLENVIIFWKGNTGRILSYRLKKVELEKKLKR